MTHPQESVDRGDPAIPQALQSGDCVSVEFRKYDGSPHWHYPASYLGADRHGVWLGGGPGTVIARPGRRFVWDGPFVLLIPADRHHVVTLNGPTRLVRTEFYVDVTTVPTWHHGAAAGDPVRVRAVDLDLDVGRRFGQTEPFLDDEDEFAAHRVQFGYPPELVEAAQAEAARLIGEVRRGDEPFGLVARAWLARVPDATRGPASADDDGR